jgi:hypothetical protein
MTSRPKLTLLLDGSRQEWLPRAYESVYRGITRNVPDDAWDVLQHGPSHPGYPAAWQTVLDHGHVVDDDGATYELWTDDNGDLWAVPHGWAYDDQPQPASS